MRPIELILLSAILSREMNMHEGARHHSSRRQAFARASHSNMNKLRILLADDHPVVRHGLRTLLSTETDMEIVGEAENGVDAIALAKATLPEVVIMDFCMPLLNGAEATRQIHQAIPSVKVLVLSSYEDQEFMQKLKEAGAAGYITKDSAAADLLKAIRDVHSGRNGFVTYRANRD